ncbi:TPA: 16S rRNA (cytidine(1402)-2'-O)-methyltransferase [Candidatus Poribacteria bacterium]|nr:16S rRNA (cytidine(1402)-2'-O)-methyltransferase [Candidatus Poribacteria bacterium]
MQPNGTLYLVSTPIGNLEDITLRALRILGEVGLVAAEDTRRTRQLLTHYNIETSVVSFFQGNERAKLEGLIDQLRSGKSIALVSDAGTPTISDPGYLLVVGAIKAEIIIVPIPGVTACMSAASVSGMPLHNFAFEGFLSPKSGKRRRKLIELSQDERTIIFYESPHRLVKFLVDVLEILGDRRICIARELTKKFEEIFYGTVSEAIDKFTDQPPRGEFTVVVAGVDL